MPVVFLVAARAHNDPIATLTGAIARATCRAVNLWRNLPPLLFDGYLLGHFAEPDKLTETRQKRRVPAGFLFAGNLQSWISPRKFGRKFGRNLDN